MKSCLKWVVILGVILLVIVFVFLQFFLGKTIKTAVEQNTDKFLNAKVEMKDLNFNLLGGSVALSGLKVSNPAGFTGDYLYKLEKNKVDLGLMALLSNQIVVEEITVKNSDLKIIRNSEGKINVNELVKKGEKKEETPVQEKAVEEKPAEEKAPVEIPPFLLKKMEITSVVEYLDEKVAEGPFKMGFVTEILSKDIATFGPEDRKGTLSIKGHLKDSKEEFVMDIQVESSPLSDMQNPTFSAVSRITSIDAKRLAVYREVIGIDEGIINISSQVTCNKGVIVSQKSMQKITVTGLKLNEKFKEKNTLLKSIDIPEDMVFSFPLSGRIESPQFNALEAFLNALAGKATEQLKEKAKEEIGKQLGDILGLKKKPDAEGAASSATDEKKSPLGDLLGRSKDKNAVDGAVEEKKNPLGSLLGGKDEAVSDDVVKEKKSPLGGLLGGDKEKAVDDVAPDEKEDKSPLGKIKKLF